MANEPDDVAVKALQEALDDCGVARLTPEEAEQLAHELERKGWVFLGRIPALNR
jgi:hypothetical protein